MKYQNGFTLVEISIVMIIIGLLIGGTFGGMKLIENMQVNRTIQDLKAIESGALTFKDTYGRLPGDIANPSVRLPNCSVVPCATGGNGNKRIENSVNWPEVLTNTSEKFTFWHHLQAADLLSMNYSNSTNVIYGDGIPLAPLEAGYRMIEYNGIVVVAGGHVFQGSAIVINIADSVALNSVPTSNVYMPCSNAEKVDIKMDDGIPYNGLVVGYSCATATLTSPYIPTNSGLLFYDLRGF